jgi:hypothetical protein
MKGRLFAAFTLVMFVALSLVGAQATTSGEWKWPQMLVSMDTNPTAPTYVLAISWAPLHEADTGTKWRVLAEASSVQKLEMMKTRKADFWWSDLHTTAQIIEANATFATRNGGSLPLVVAHQGFLQMSGLATMGDSRLQTLQDIKKGTRVSVAAGTTAIMQFLDGFEAWLNLDKGGLVKVPFSDFPSANRALPEGKVEVGFSDPTSLFAREQDSSPRGIRFFDFPASDSAGYARFKEVIPTVDFGVNTMGVKGGQGVRMMRIRFQGIAMEDADPEMVYRLVKWLDENHDRYKSLNINAPMMNIDTFMDMARMTYIPLHAGTIRYLREKNLWTAQDERRQEYNTRLMRLYNQAYADAVVKADAAKVDVNPRNAKWLEFWANHKVQSGLPRLRIMTDAEIAADLPKLPR